MKYISALFTLLLAGSPCLADDFLYIECKTSTRAVFTEIKTKKLIKEETRDESLILKIDLANNQFTTHKDNTWDDMEIKERKLKATINKDQNGLLVNGILEIEVDPVGTLQSKINFIAWAIATEVEMSGDCHSVDEPVFNTAKQKTK